MTAMLNHYAWAQVASIRVYFDRRAASKPLERGEGSYFRVGYLGRTKVIDTAHMRRAMVYGATMGSYSVSGFGVKGFETVTTEDVEKRVQQFIDLTHVPMAEPEG